MTMGLILTDALQAAKGAKKETAGPVAACVPRRSRMRGQDLHSACGTCKELFQAHLVRRKKKSNIHIHGGERGEEHRCSAKEKRSVKL